MYETLDLTIFGHRSVILGYFLVAMMGLKCGLILDDFMLWHFWLNHFWSLRSVWLRYIFWLLRTIGYLIISDILVVNRELLCSWFSMDNSSWRFDAFYAYLMILLWIIFCDFEIYESMSIRVGYLHVVMGSACSGGWGPKRLPG